MRAFLVSLCLATTISAQAIVYGPPLPFQPLAVGDVDADGRDDYAGTLTGNLVVHSGATGLPIPYMTRPAAGLGYSGAGDTNADGHDDLVWLNVTATVLSGADGTVLHTWSPTTPFVNFTSVVGGADFDADGFGDVVLVSGNQLHEVRSGRTGQILYSLVAGGLFAPTTVFLGDSNGDGYEDLSIAVLSLGVMHVVRGPDFSVTVNAAASPRGIGDLNCNGATDTATRPAGGTTTTFVDGATGLPIGSLPYATFQAPNLVPLRDVDGDGHDDLLAWMPAQSFPPAPAFAEVISGRTLLAQPGPANLFANALGDLDGDGRFEAWVGVAGTPTIVEWVDPAFPIVSRLTRRGSSGTGSNGHKPRLTTRGSCALGKPVFFDLRGTVPSGLSLLLLGGPLDIDLTFLGAPGNHLYANPDGALLLLSDTNGLAVQSFTMPLSPSLLGSMVSVQAAAWDPVANAWGFVYSNAIDVATNN